MAIPDELMRKYGVGGLVSVPVTSMTTVELPMSSFSAALLLAELYQHEGRLEDAIRLLESLGAVSGQAILALSLAELYAARARWDDVIRVSDRFTRNVDDPTAQLLTLRGIALGRRV